MAKWIPGNKITLLENGEDFFPRVFDCIAAAQREVVVETFILFDDKVGWELHAALLKAASNGAQIDLTVDGYGSFNLPEAFLAGLVSAGIRVHVFDPNPKLLKWRTNVFRRMHRKIVVIDAERAFVGGINYGADHLADFGPEGKQDYAVEIEGPVVSVIHDFVHRALAAGQRHAKELTPPTTHASAGSARAQPHFGGSRMLPRNWGRWSRPPPASQLPVAGPAEVIFVTRDNRRHTNDIEKHYRIAIRAARQRVVIANAYFFPGYRLLKEMRKASRRGVDVRLILQGEPDMPIVKTAASMLYHHLMDAGVKIYEYCERPLHGKVALSDDEWSTVGSSNLDPLSLSLNLEANVVIKDRAFNQHLFDRLSYLMAHSCREIGIDDIEKPGFWRTARSYVVFHLLRRYPAWAGLLPAHTPRLTPAYEAETKSPSPSTAAAGSQSGGSVDSVSRADPA